MNWKENDWLAKASYETQLKLNGPETLLFSPDGHLVVGLVDGRVISVNTTDGSIELLADFSRFQTNKRPCDSSKKSANLLKCSFQLGLRFKPNTNTLYVSVPFEGIFKIDTNKSESWERSWRFDFYSFNFVVLLGSLYQVLKADDPRFGAAKLKLIADLEVEPGETGSIYFVDSSLRLRDDENELTEELPSGRFVQTWGTTIKHPLAQTCLI